MFNNIEERLLGSQEEDRSDLKWRVWVESKKMWRVAAPGILARVTAFGIVVVTQSFIGHISELDLAAYALVQTFIVRLSLWYNSILVLIAGYMLDAEIAISAFSICLNVSAWQLMIFIGFLGAATVRVANELGRGDAKAVKFSIKVIMSTSVVLGLVFFILCLIFGQNIGYLFTSNEEVAEAVANLSVLLAFTMLLSSIQPVLSGVTIGAGLQGTVAIINLCSFYVIGIPLGALLAYVAGLEVKSLRFWDSYRLGAAAAAVVDPDSAGSPPADEGPSASVGSDAPAPDAESIDFRIFSIDHEIGHERWRIDLERVDFLGYFRFGYTGFMDWNAFWGGSTDPCSKLHDLEN
ncbi:hypothetical protein Vadar_023533 [Vaccinium darrowii]|uniref:Uncharacterized protein n=1 Tax=Vaccinium darrowii TaxID=229202 RepID=A0ACB7YNT7_9ERIC|nr:hypothetical protein Vadar_023533 [Vaccinium darrowii]